MINIDADFDIVKQSNSEEKEKKQAMREPKSK